MSDIEPHKLKVTELRDELKKRGLDTKGKKEQLVKRLLQALGMDDAGADDSHANVEDSDTSHLCDTSVASVDVTAACDGIGEQPAVDTAANGDDSVAATQSIEPVIVEAALADTCGDMKVEAAPEVCASAKPFSADASSELEAAPVAEDGGSLQSSESALSNSGQAVDVKPADSEIDVDMAAVAESRSEPTTGSAQYTLPASESSGATMSSSQQSTEEASPAAALAAEDRAAMTAAAAAVSQADVEVGGVVIAESTGEATSASACGDGEPAEAVSVHEPAEKMEQDDEAPAPAQGPTAVVVDSNAAVKDSSNNDVAAGEDTKKEALQKNGHGEPVLAARDRSRSPRRRSRSPAQQRQRSPQSAISADDESWMLSNEVQLDRYNSDLNMIIKDNYTAVPLCQAGFAYMWAGAKATHGVASGKVAFEFKVTDEPRVDLPADEQFPNVARIGWSPDTGSIQLGEDRGGLSWGYGGTGKTSHNNVFKDYGQPYRKGDVITAYLDLESSPVTISFSKNGADLGIAFEVEKSALKGQALFPTILSKNAEFAVNFGHKEAAFPLREGYSFIGHVPSEQRVRAVVPPAKKSDAEVLMLIGLPGAGKTYWAAKQCEAHPEKRYNVLGTNAIIDKMKVPIDMVSERKIKVYVNQEILDLRREKRMLERKFKKRQDVATGATYKIVTAEYRAKIKRVTGLQRKYNYSGRWDVLFDRSNQCLTKLIDLASSKCRNYILDQTNVYATAQKRKMKPFEAFRRKAVVIVPSEDDFLSRTVKRIKEEAKQVPDEAILEMKANFSVPSVGDVFDELIFPELPEPEARKLVAQYVKEGQVKFPLGARRFNDRRSGPEQQAGVGNRDAGRGRGYAGPRDNLRNDKPSYGSSYRTGGGSGSNGASASFASNRYEERNSRPERGYYPAQSPPVGGRGFSSGQNTYYGGSGNYSASSKPYSAPTPPAQPTGGPWAGGPGRPGAGAPIPSGPQPTANWGTGWGGSPTQQPTWGSSYGPSSGVGATAPAGQAGGYGSGYRAQAASYGTQSSEYGTRSASHGIQSGGYGSQSTGYGSQSGGYSSQSTGYGAQSGGYGAQSGGYGAQSGGSGAQYGGSGAQSGGYGAQTGGYGTQAGSSSAQLGGYGSQPVGYGVQSGGTASQSGGYDAQPRAYGAQGGSYGNQGRSYASQAGGYSSPAGSYGSQAGSSSNQSRSYGSTAGYAQGQSTSAAWPSQPQPPSRPTGTAAPLWGQQPSSVAAAWQQSSYGQRR